MFTMNKADIDNVRKMSIEGRSLEYMVMVMELGMDEILYLLESVFRCYIHEIYFYRRNGNLEKIIQIQDSVIGFEYPIPNLYIGKRYVLGLGEEVEEIKKLYYIE
jgi:hypothetical protein